MTWHGPYGMAPPGRWWVDPSGTRWKLPEKFLYLDAGTLDIGIIRWTVGWRTVLHAAARPWRWRRIPGYLRHLGQPVEPANEFRTFFESFADGR